MLSVKFNYLIETKYDNTSIVQNTISAIIRFYYDPGMNIFSIIKQYISKAFFNLELGDRFRVDILHMVISSKL